MRYLEAMASSWRSLGASLRSKSAASASANSAVTHRARCDPFSCCLFTGSVGPSTCKGRNVNAARSHTKRTVILRLIRQPLCNEKANRTWPHQLHVIRFNTSGGAPRRRRKVGCQASVRARSRAWNCIMNLIEVSMRPVSLRRGSQSG